MLGIELGKLCFCGGQQPLGFTQLGLSTI